VPAPNLPDVDLRIFTEPQFGASYDQQLRLAKLVRRSVLRGGMRGADELEGEADRHFGLPSTTLTFSDQLESPLYLPNRSPSN